MKERFSATNRKAFRDYTILETFECGIELKGSEVKSIRAGNVNLKDSFARIEGKEFFLYNMHISPYEQASYLNVAPTRTRRLLLHNAQIQRLSNEVNQKRLTLVPLKLYFNKRGFVKLELALTKGKRLYDKREALKKKEINLEIKRALRRKDR
ncbi:MAG: SsrA-binding protein SmpB [Candidatus Omnitrophota bacterium]|nr:SsrA-binding protein SmpB [Candidatus Omnitrophota bacterium]